MFCGGVQVLPGECCSMALSLGLFAGLGRTRVGCFHGCNFLLLALLLVLFVIRYNPWGFGSSMYVCGLRGVHALAGWLVYSLWIVMFLVCMGLEPSTISRVIDFVQWIVKWKTKWNVQEYVWILNIIVPGFFCWGKKEKCIVYAGVPLFGSRFEMLPVTRFLSMLIGSFNELFHYLDFISMPETYMHKEK